MSKSSIPSEEHVMPRVKLSPRRSRPAGGLQAEARSGDEIVGEGVPERLGLGLDQAANGEKTKAMVLAVGIDAFDALAQGVDGLAGLARHPFPPRLSSAE